jgi:hypothetical protein
VPASGPESGSIEDRLVRVFYDADVLIAGAAPTSGASHILPQLPELTLIECVTSPTAVAEAERNIATKLPAASSVFRKILAAAIRRAANQRCSLPRFVRGHPVPKSREIK